MDFILMSDSSDYQLQSYSAGTLVINEHVYQSSVLVSAHSLVAWQPQSITNIHRTDLAALLALKADVILLGTGANMQFLAPELQCFIRDQCLPLEVMTTYAAMGTFQVLCVEQRLVYAALLV